MIDVSPRHDQAMPEVGLRVALDRRQVKRDDILVVAKEAAREVNLARDFTADQAAVAQGARLTQRRVTFPNTGLALPPAFDRLVSLA